jgi:hypothetical protein
VTGWPPDAVDGDTEFATGGVSAVVEVPIENRCRSPIVAPSGNVTLVSVLPASTGTAA